MCKNILHNQVDKLDTNKTTKLSNISKGTNGTTNTLAKNANKFTFQVKTNIAGDTNNVAQSVGKI
jgi:hypothetical protein